VNRNLSVGADHGNEAEHEVDEQGRPEPPLTADELGTLVAFLEFQRATLAWKCEGLDETGMRATLSPSTMTLGGLLKHLAWVEDYWFSCRLLGREPHETWTGVDWKADPDHEWTSAAHDPADELRTLWGEAVERSRDCLQEALRRGELDQLASRAWADGRAPNLRWILTHMVEEYSRHNGHADLLRESVDGLTGE
jgi:uncharacterized damage-inducible protein DinB